jgi:hypothetical protein
MLMNMSIEKQMEPRNLVRAEPAFRDGPWAYGALERMGFAQSHEGFFRLCLEVMTTRDEKLLGDRWFAELTLKELAAKYYITRERIRQIEGKAFRSIFMAIEALWEGK